MTEDEAGWLVALRDGAVVGIGVDMEPVSRWADPDPRLFTDEENSYCRIQANTAESYAGTWCVKEAVVKAAYPTVPILTRDVHVCRGRFGAPGVRLPGGLPVSAMASISHSAGLAIAVALAVAKRD